MTVTTQTVDKLWGTREVSPDSRTLVRILDETGSRTEAVIRALTRTRKKEEEEEKKKEKTKKKKEEIEEGAILVVVVIVIQRGLKTRISTTTTTIWMGPCREKKWTRICV
jgi:arsenate reductase-like glutaredoxin family protein